MRTVAQVRADLEAASAELDAARNRWVQLKEELDKAAVVEAQGHPLFGKKVERVVNRGWNSRQTRQSGTVVAYDRQQHGSLRGLRYVRGGELIVLSVTGKSAWKLYDFGKLQFQPITT